LDLEIPDSACIIAGIGWKDPVEKPVGAIEIAKASTNTYNDGYKRIENLGCHSCHSAKNSMHGKKCSGPVVRVPPG
jgi:hypothetical protein